MMAGLDQAPFLPVLDIEEHLGAADAVREVLEVHEARPSTAVAERNSSHVVLGQG